MNLGVLFLVQQKSFTQTSLFPNKFLSKGLALFQTKTPTFQSEPIRTKKVYSVSVEFHSFKCFTVV